MFSRKGNWFLTILHALKEVRDALLILSHFLAIQHEMPGSWWASLAQCQMLQITRSDNQSSQLQTTRTGTVLDSSNRTIQEIVPSQSRVAYLTTRGCY
jgi:hypothetical protein